MSKKATSNTSTGNIASLLKLTIPAGQASPSPPIGPALGQKGVKAMDFCKQFNDQSRHYQPGIPLRTFITIQPDRSFSFLIRPPSTTWLVKRAAGVEKASSERVVARLSVKYAYEIAKMKKLDPLLQHIPLQSIYRMVIHSAKTFGIEFC